MPVPWLQLIDAALGVANFARGRSAPQASASQELQAAPPLQGGLEARLAGVVVAALKEAFDRDSRRLELEREQLAAERLRAERAMRLELRRQAADHEIGRQRLLAGVAFAAWIGTLAFSSRVIGGPLGARLALGAGWLFLLGAIASSFAAQSQAAAAVEALAADDDPRRTEPGVAGAFALWLLLLGLVVIGVAALIA
jgi:hypothetical protein